MTAELQRTTISKPDPDPTVLTTQALQREVAAIDKLFDQRMNGVEKAIEVAHENLVRVPTDVEKAVGHLKELMMEKFAGIATQFAERDTRVDQTAKASKEALDAALQAAKEAVGEQNKSSSLSIAKSEAATDKRIDQILATITGIQASFQGTIEDLKERINRSEGMRGGAMEALSSRREASNSIANWGGLIAGAVLAIVAAVAFLIAHVTTH